MIRAPAARAKNTSTAAAETNNFKELIIMLEYDEYRISLAGLEQDINDLRDSL